MPSSPNSSSSPRPPAAAGDRTERFLQSVLDSLEDRVNIVDRDYRIVYANAALLKSCGKSREAIVGTRCYETYWGSDVPCEVCVTPKTFETGRPHFSAHEEVDADGVERYIEHYTFPIVEKGGVAYVIECLRDATARRSQERRAREGTLELGRRLKELRHAYREREHLQEQLMHAERMASIGQIASTMAHELDTPLNTISGYCELLSETLGDEDRAKVQSMADQAARCHKIIRDALDYARRPSGKRVPTDVGKLVLETVALLDYSLRAARVKVVTDLEPDLPRLCLNAEKVQQVFWNLLTNACDAMPDGGEIRIGGRRSGDHVEMTFRDTGEGIETPDLKKVFEPFFTTKKQGEGTGLGLSICRSIMADCGGEISARNADGGGAEFCLRFPIER